MRSDERDDPLPERLLLKVEDAARLLSVSRSQMYEMVKTGVVPSVLVGNARRIHADGLRRWVDAQLEQPPPMEAE